MRQCDRSEAHAPILAAAYALFENLSADAAGPAQALFESRDSVNIIMEHMQMCRDRPDLVAAAVRTVVNLCSDAGRAAEVACTGKILARIRSIAEIMGRPGGLCRFLISNNWKHFLARRCLLIHAEASLTHSVSISDTGGRGKAWCLLLYTLKTWHDAAASA